MIHSLYSNKEIFLRELISNASDACDKLRFEALADQALCENDPRAQDPRQLRPAARTITVSDNGVGMSRDEVITNIGTIAKSGTREFFQSLTGDQAKDAHLIGQFGVGFYSSFIVADHVTLVTRRAGMGAEHGVRWESDGQGEYTPRDRGPVRAAAPTSPCTCARARTICCPGFRLRSILRKYSDHITIPILMKKEEWDKDKNEHVVKDETSRSTRPPRCGRGRSRRSPTSSTRSSTSTSRTTSRRRWPGRTRGSRASRSTPSCCTSRRMRRSTCGTATTATASSSTCGASSSWTTPSS